MKGRLVLDTLLETLFSNYGKNPKYYRAKKAAKQKYPF